MMPQRASRRRIRSIRACIVNLLSVVRTIVDGGEAGAAPALPLGRRRRTQLWLGGARGALEGRGGAAPASHLREGGDARGRLRGRREPGAGGPPRASRGRLPGLRWSPLRRKHSTRGLPTARG